jgi:hypothetical protein
MAPACLMSDAKYMPVAARLKLLAVTGTALLSACAGLTVLAVAKMKAALIAR